MPDLAVVVVTYDSSETIGACLESILFDASARVVVVDNASDPATAAICAQQQFAARVSYLDPGANLGYAKAANLGLAELAGRDTVAVVNPDVRLTRTLSELLDVARPERKDVVAGRLASSVPGAVNARPATTPLRELAKAILGSRAYRRVEPPLPGTRVRAVDQLDGALLVLRADRWAELGGFDERYELYYEDVDFCARIRHDGACLLVWEEWGEHIGGHSYQRSGGTAYQAMRVSRVRYARRWWQPQALGLSAVLVVSALEFAVRSLTRQAEGQRVRNRALRSVLAELWMPGRVQVLQSSNPKEQEAYELRP